VNKTQTKKPAPSSRKTSTSSYESLSRIDGRHPLQDCSPEMCLLYNVRTRPGAEVAYFNFDLAREMGLIEASHPNRLNAELSRALISAFSLVIINEYDIENKISFPKDSIRPHKYMATRYLQLQHPNKTGKTSGDGRSIWNGTWTHKNRTWDLSSCGTGATALSPAVALHNRNFKTGDTTVSYGCGLADYSDALGAAMLSEIFHKNGTPTERTLAVLRFKDGTSINVRAGENLVRPAHMFRYLKLSERDNLKSLVDYHIAREKKNGRWQPETSSSDPYLQLLDIFCRDFARSAALFEREYIFCWLDWDGDNILISEGAILDYGSVRQFGLFHRDYRYDDVERWSTNIPEQKSKARYLVQTFAQMIDFLRSGDKKNVRRFANDPVMDLFEARFAHFKKKFLLRNMGLSEKHQNHLLQKHSSTVSRFETLFEHFERQQSAKGLYKVDDGITSDAVFCMRDVLRELPKLYLAEDTSIKDGTFIEIARSSYAGDKDLTLTPSRSRHIQNFQKQYRRLLHLAGESERRSFHRTLLEITMRSSLINRHDRITGNGIIRVADHLVKKKIARRGSELLSLLPEFIRYQVQGLEISPSHHGSSTAPVLRRLIQIVQDSREEI
jgi:hypothetical protein